MVDKRIRIILDSKGAKRNADELNDSVKDIGTNADRSQFSVNKLAAAIAAVISVQKITQFADAFTRVQNQLLRTVNSTEELAASTQQLLNVANQTRAGIEPTVELYTSLTVSTRDLALSQDELVDVTKTINNLFVESGKGANETAGAIRQLGQALESGALRGDEFNSVAEGAPGILRAIQLQTGLTRAELRDLAADGQITAELIVKSLQNYSEEAQKAADKTEITLAQAFTVAENNITAFVGRLDKSLNVSGSFAKAVIDLSENIDSLTTAAGAAAAIYVAKLIPSITASVSAQIASNQALIARALSEQSLALGIARRADAEAAGALSTLNSARADLEAISAKVALTRAYATNKRQIEAYDVALSQQLAAQKIVNAAVEESARAASVAAAANARLSTANAQVASTATIAGRAVGALRAGMSFLGGPLGVVFLAATALFYFGQKAKEAINPTDLLAQSVENLTDAQRDLLKLNINKAFDEQVTIIEDASKKIKFLQDTLTRGTVTSKEGIKAANDELVIQKARLDDARISAEKLTEKLANLIKPSDPSSGGTTTTTTSSGAVDADSDLQDALDRENANLRVIQSAENVTKSLENELSLRRTISDIYRSNELDANASFYEQQLAQIKIREAEELAIAQAKATEESAQREERLAATLENDKLTLETRAALKAEFDAQELTAAQILEEQKTAIQEEATNARIELDRAEWKARLDNAGALGSALINLGQGQSKKIFKIGQTLALAQAAVALPTAVLESYKNGGGYPWGLVPAGIMLATGLKNIQQIRSAGAGLGGGGGSVPTPSLGSATGTSGQPSIPTTASTQQVEQRRVYELRGVAGNDKITVDQFRELMEQDGAVVVLSDSVNDAARRNVTGVTAR